MDNKKRGTGIVSVVGIVLMAVLLYFVMGGFSAPQTKDMTLSKVVSYFRDTPEDIRSFSLDMGDGQLEIRLYSDKVEERNDKTKDEVIRYRVADKSSFWGDENTVRQMVEAYNASHPDAPIEYEIKQAGDDSLLVMLVAYGLPTLLLVGFMVFLFRRMGQENGQAMNFGKTRAKPQPENGKKVTFADVAGAEEEKEELSEIVDFLKNPRLFNDMGARVPKGVLLVGPPGTGKTLLARAVAGEAGVPFFSISGSDFVEMFVGVGASRVRDLFTQAKKGAPSIVFIDEIDAVGRHRGAGLGGGHDEREQTLNQLLVEMDGFAPNEGVIVMAATNRRDILDPALLRAGRFDRQIYVGHPDIKGREEILRIHTRNKPLAPDVDLKVVARGTSGFTGADLENVANEAALIATRNRHKAITMSDFNDATIRVIAGPEKKSRVVTEEDKRITAYHEAGHAVVTYYLETQDPVHEISIIPRGMAAGYTLALPEEQKSHMTRTEMFESICVLLAGRVAEQLVLQDVTTGASNDIERATGMAREMVTRYGFSDVLGPVLYGSDQDEVFLGKSFSSAPAYSENVAASIDQEIRKLVEKAYTKATELLSAHLDQLELVTAALTEHEKLDGEDFRQLMEEGKLDRTNRSAATIFEKGASYHHKEKKAAEEEKEDPFWGTKETPAE